VGPRPDVPGYADALRGVDQVILSVRPGMTGPATLAFRDEERLLAKAADPQSYNDEVIYPMKVTINRRYVESYSFSRDMRYIFDTVFGRQYRETDHR
jgi:lipopolysaccharide/colanic/teichoic acid biosynthesis glycosyltransferase